MDHIKDFKKLKNNYFFMRHGESKANIENIIISEPTAGKIGYGLTFKGKNQVINSIESENSLDKNTIIFSSDFLRAKETAMLVANILKTSPVIFSSLLRERYFGDFEKTSDENYKKVWDYDVIDYRHKNNNVESVENIINRTTKLVQEMENKYFNRNILLVSHGDVLQILQTAFFKIHPSKHRNLEHIHTAQIKKIN
ncbi:MAG: histidine phosphatase family protein [Nanobdellota archaeon]